MLTSAKARSRNRAYRSILKNAIRKVTEASGLEDAKSALTNAIKVIDRAASKGIIHKNRAADKKSRLTAFVRTIEA
jgi:small subunit ribosomal protein S20